MKNFQGKKSTKANLYFVVITILCVLLVVFSCVMNFELKEVARVNLEESYHAADRVYGANFLNNADNISFVEDEDCYVGIVGQDGNMLIYNSGKNSYISADNLIKYLKNSQLSNMTVDEAFSMILNGSEGEFEFYGGNQSKVLLYTPVTPSEYAVVRVIPKKLFIQNQNGLDKYSPFLLIIIALFIFISALRFRAYSLGVEDSIAKHDLIAEDNDLISFTYHSSIASFEMTGAVAKVFGEEIGKRGQIDWNALSRLLHPDDQMLLRNISKAIKKGDVKYTTEFRLVDLEGEFHWYRLNGKCIFDENNDVKKFVGTIQNSDDQISHENMLKNKAEHDLLTGLLNKITIQEAVDATILGGSYSAYAFYIIDLDNFKAVNDNLGHAAGDKVLTDVASKLQLVFNEVDLIGRLGGDEFAVLLVIPSMMVSQAEKLITEKAKLLNEILREEYGDNDITIKVSASIGIATYPADGEDFQTLYQHADRALYHSKENGKNQFTFYTEVV